MNTDIIESIDRTIAFLKELIYQLSKFNSINESDIKLLCFIIYKQNTIEKNKEIDYLIVTALGYINKNTKIYATNDTQIVDYNKIFDYYINNQLRTILQG